RQLQQRHRRFCRIELSPANVRPGPQPADHRRLRRHHRPGHPRRQLHQRYRLEPPPRFGEGRALGRGLSLYLIRSASQMTLETSFTRLVGCTVPIQLAGMGSILSPELAAAVSDAGALGQITFAGIPAADAQQRLDTLLSLASTPFRVNLLIPYLDRDILKMSDGKAKVIDFFWGDPDPELVKLVHEAGSLCSWQVGSV